MQEILRAKRRAQDDEAPGDLLHIVEPEVQCGAGRPLPRGRGSDRSTLGLSFTAV